MSNPITGKHIIIGVTGSIAAYKAAELASKLTQAGALVDCILTESATRFVTPLTFQSVTSRKAYTDDDLWAGEGHVVHIGLAHEADLLLIAPVSANTLAKLAHGIADNLLSVTALAATCPSVLAPAMDAGMYAHPATQQNVQILKGRGAEFIGPEPGHLASGLIGLGRFAEPDTILRRVRYLLSRDGKLAGKRVLLTVGPTQEALDPVRYISNRSSGKQGYAIAQALLDEGATVTLVSGPTNLPFPEGAQVIEVTSAAEMKDAVLAHLADKDAFISVAAVADFTPRAAADEKIKKTGHNLTLELVPTVDILRTVSEERRRSNPNMLVIGFAAETNRVYENALKKLQEKGLDLIVVNNVGQPQPVFGADQNKVTFLSLDGQRQEFPWMEKYAVGEKLVEFLLRKWDL
ncbi:MAG TPA: bifunctional phosphopantothenoylcysteine decarboxylase/phosphopantothenate--cysteine ligase CoaBC [Anaerolineaceae bacterium]|nr:bifunctional phosphopantothenoylcysteine decarboxylase/phosphopantothenate--cysteine ligase CoaBC [Anaerolineaceae bacterium]